ncbi:MAG: TetR/AcrR family transcriptional regulator [Proteobacteria bacterium]|nr:TetR/AcrR family transcriptional regulator [Pseudomonadota bacterium]
MNDHSVSARKRDKRRQILEAAVGVFAKQGFHKSRVSDVARAAEVADGTIYLYFKSKDDILISIFEETMADMIERVQLAIESHSDPLDQLREFALFHMRNVEEHRDVAKVLQVELRLSSTFMKEYKPTRLQQYMDIIGRLISEGKEAGVIRADVNPIIARRAFFGALDEIAMQWILTPNARYGLNESAEQIAELFVRGLQS